MPAHGVRLVTGYVPLPSHPRRQEDYVRLGSELLSLPVPITAFLDPIGTAEVRTGAAVDVRPASLEDCWLWQATRGGTPTLPTTDNPAKDTLAYHCVQAQKTAWVAEVAATCDEEILVWVDFGLLHLRDRGVTTDGILSLVEWCQRMAPCDSPILASIWGEPTLVDASRISWWCAGGVFVMPRGRAAWWHEQVRGTGEILLRTYGRVTFEVNLWAAAWTANRSSVRHWRCDHDRTILEPWRCPVVS